MRITKIVILLFSLTILSGCTSTYRLEIDGSNFKETIDTYIYDGDREADLYDGIESGDRIDGLIDGDVYPYFANYDYVYEKKVNILDDYEKVVLKYKYKDSEYKDSNAVNLCFENRNFKIEKDYYDIDLTGYFYCLYNNEKVDIEIKTNNKVINHNADSKSGNKYIWHINQSNFKDVSIKMQVSKENSKIKIYSVIIISTLIILLLISILLIINKVKKSDRF